MNEVKQANHLSYSPDTAGHDLLVCMSYAVYSVYIVV